MGEDVRDKTGIKRQEQVEKPENSLRLEGRLEQRKELLFCLIIKNTKGLPEVYYRTTQGFRNWL